MSNLLKDSIIHVKKIAKINTAKKKSAEAIWSQIYEHFFRLPLVQMKIGLK